ncbi:MAG: copper amine oxidase N-terminal domain-containing protein [Alicyclobacillaceae bacterium]|nr:copper amine oxidase N-terminal domain-containing protein [Alicyclobacillaceae bacterium]
MARGRGKRMRRRAVLAVPLAILLSAASPAAGLAAASGPPALRVEVDGQEIAGLPVVVENGTSWVPVRKAAEFLHAGVGWNDGVVSVRRGATELSFEVGSDRVKVGGASEQLPGPVRIRDGAAYVPLRLLAEKLGYRVEWDGTNGKVAIRPSEQRLQEIETIRDLLAKTTKASQSLDRCAADVRLNLEGRAKEGATEEHFTATGTLRAVYQRSPLALSAEGQLSLTGGPVSVPPMPLRAYLAEGRLYVMDPLDQKWYFMPFDTQFLEQLLKEPDNPVDKEIRDLIVPGAELRDAGDSYIISVDLNPSMMKKIEELLGEAEASPAPVPPLPEDAAVSIHYDFTIRKADFYTTAVHLEESISQAPGVELKVALDEDIHQFNSAPPVNVPEEVKQKAVPLNLPEFPPGAASVPLP